MRHVSCGINRFSEQAATGRDAITTYFAKTERPADPAAAAAAATTVSSFDADPTAPQPPSLSRPRSRSPRILGDRAPKKVAGISTFFSQTTREEAMAAAAATPAVTSVSVSDISAPPVPPRSDLAPTSMEAVDADVFAALPPDIQRELRLAMGASGHDVSHAKGRARGKKSGKGGSVRPRGAMDSFLVKKHVAKKRLAVATGTEPPSKRRK